MTTRKHTIKVGKTEITHSTWTKQLTFVDIEGNERLIDDSATGHVMKLIEVIKKGSGKKPQAFVLGSLTVTRMSPDAPGCLVFSFHDSDGVRRQIADHSGNVQRLIDAAAQPFTAVPTQSGNTKKDF